MHVWAMTFSHKSSLEKNAEIISQQYFPMTTFEKMSWPICEHKHGYIRIFLSAHIILCSFEN